MGRTYTRKIAPLLGRFSHAYMCGVKHSALGLDASLAQSRLSFELSVH